MCGGDSSGCSDDGGGLVIKLSGNEIGVYESNNSNNNNNKCTISTKMNHIESVMMARMRDVVIKIAITVDNKEREGGDIHTANLLLPAGNHRWFQVING